MENIKNEVAIDIADNICYYRKKLNLTQFELAEKLNYSDKTISKWERAEGVPDIFVLKELAKLFDISLDSLTSKRKGPFKILKYKNVLAHFYASICLLIGFLMFGVLTILEVDFPTWQFLVYSVPAASTVLFVFYLVWQRLGYIHLYMAILIWSLALSLFLGLDNPNAYWIFVIAVPLHAFLIMMLYVIYKPKRVK